MPETKTMNKDKYRAFKSVRREIARRLKAQLPLAGMIAATTLFCGCNEQPSRGPIGKMQTKDDTRCEQSEKPKPKTPPKKNGEREVKERPLAGALLPPPNSNNECERP